MYDWEFGGKSIPGGEPGSPAWLVDLIGVDYFGHVVAVHLPPSQTAHEAIAQIGRLGRLEQLRLGGLFLDDTELFLDDTELAHLKGLTNLRILELDRTRVTDAGLAHLKGLTELSIVFLHDTRITKAGTDKLKRSSPKLDISH